MKVCHITTIHPSKDNRIFYKECKSLAKCGFDVKLVAVNSDSFVEDGVEVIGVKCTYSNRFHRAMKASYCAYKEAKKTKADIFHFHDPEFMIAALMLRLLGKTVIYDIHENNPAAIMSKPYLNSNFIKKVMALCFNIAEQISVRIFSYTVTARPDITKRFNIKNIKTIFNYPILPEYDKIPTLNLKKNKQSVIYVGGMSRIRGIRELISAFENIPNAELWLLGTFEDESFQEECKKLPGSANVRYLGQVESFEIFSYIKASDAGIITFWPEPNHLTTIATKPFEYMACGVPVIMSDFDYWKDFFGENAIYVDPKDPNQIARTITQLLEDPNKAKSMGQRGLEKVKEEYNWAQEEKKLIGVYKSIINKGNE